jgi:hypothetical protein
MRPVRSFSTCDLPQQGLSEVRGDEAVLDPRGRFGHQSPLAGVPLLQRVDLGGPGVRLIVKQTRRSRRWVILGLPGPSCRWCGPYRTRAEAQDARRGMERFFKKHGKENHDDAQVF